jgi:hypothetical protein
VTSPSMTLLTNERSLFPCSMTLSPKRVIPPA